jgi:hypothetical protein
VPPAAASPSRLCPDSSGKDDHPPAVSHSG